MDTIALVLIIVGALNWGAIGLFQFDLIATLFGGMGTTFSRILYTVLGLSGLWGVGILYRRNRRKHVEGHE